MPFAALLGCDLDHQMCFDPAGRVSAAKATAAGSCGLWQGRIDLSFRFGLKILRGKFRPRIPPPVQLPLPLAAAIVLDPA